MRQISGEIRVVHLQNYQLNSISRVRTELILLVGIFGGPCRIRTHVSGSEGRKDIQTTLTVHASYQRGRPIFNAPDGRVPPASIGSCGP